jgi:hypothetical protein
LSVNFENENFLHIHDTELKKRKQSPPCASLSNQQIFRMLKRRRAVGVITENSETFQRLLNFEEHSQHYKAAIDFAYECGMQLDNSKMYARSGFAKEDTMLVVWQRIALKFSKKNFVKDLFQILIRTNAHKAQKYIETPALLADLALFTLTHSLLVVDYVFALPDVFAFRPTVVLEIMQSKDFQPSNAVRVIEKLSQRNLQCDIAALNFVENAERCRTPMQCTPLFLAMSEPRFEDVMETLLQVAANGYVDLDYFISLDGERWLEQFSRPFSDRVHYLESSLCAFSGKWMSVECISSFWRCCEQSSVKFEIEKARRASEVVREQCFAEVLLVVPSLHPIRSIIREYTERPQTTNTLTMK